MDAREKEENLLVKCLQVGLLQSANFDALEANAFVVAAKLIANSFPSEAAHLNVAGTDYLTKNGAVPMKCEELIHSGLIAGLPRFKQMLEHKFRKNSHAI